MPDGVLAVPVLRRNHACDPLENFGKIIGIIISHPHPHILHTDIPVLQKLFCLVHPEIGQIRGEILVKALFK